MDVASLSEANTGISFRGRCYKKNIKVWAHVRETCRLAALSVEPDTSFQAWKAGRGYFPSFET